MTLFGNIENWTVSDWAAIIGAIITVLGGWQGLRALIRRASDLVRLSENLDLKIKAFDDVVQGLSSLQKQVSEIDDRQKANGAAISTRAVTTELTFLAHLELSETPCWIADGTGLVTYVNSACCVLLHRQRDELLGDAWRDAVFEADRDRVAEKWYAFATGSRTLFSDKFRLSNPDGSAGVEVNSKAVRRADATLKVASIFGRLHAIGG